eukprot:TRINITY_DN2585_c0_g3_i1.p1 TRINITY_DN2585_c0_g3~~TRINITY_DN2585_c0_g3_i1.p1  ORF type:complete len:533 (+),score=81.22 TRINITY_DN2585_c0_g3_i1:192-1790(+)
MFISELIVFAIGLLGAFVRGLTGFGNLLVVLTSWSILNVLGVHALPRLKQIMVCNSFAAIPGGIVFMSLANACDNAQLGFAFIVVVCFNVGAAIGAELITILKQQILMIIVGFMLIVAAMVLNFFQPAKNLVRSIKSRKQDQNNEQNSNNNDNNNILNINDQSIVYICDGKYDDDVLTTDGNSENISNQNNDIKKIGGCDDFLQNVNNCENLNNTKYSLQKVVQIVNNSVSNGQKIIDKNDSIENNYDSNDSNVANVEHVDNNNNNTSKKNLFQKILKVCKQSGQTIAKVLKIFRYILRGNVKCEKIQGDKRLLIKFEFHGINQIQNYKKTSRHDSSSSSSDDDNNDDDDEQQIIEWEIKPNNLGNQDIIYVEDDQNVPLIQSSKKQTPKKSRFSDELHMTFTSGFYKAIKYIILAGFLSGFLGALLGNTAPPMMILIQAFDLKKVESIALMSVVSFFNYSVFFYVASGVFKKAEILLYVAYTVGYFLGLAFGTLAGKNMSQVWFKRILSVLVVVAAVVLVCKGFKLVPDLS